MIQRPLHIFRCCIRSSSLEMPVHILIDMLLNIMANKDIHKILKNRGIFARAKLSSLTLLCAVHGVRVK